MGKIPIRQERCVVILPDIHPTNAYTNVTIK